MTISFTEESFVLIFIGYGLLMYFIGVFVGWKTTTTHMKVYLDDLKAGIERTKASIEVAEKGLIDLREKLIRDHERAVYKKAD